MFSILAFLSEKFKLVENLIKMTNYFIPIKRREAKIHVREPLKLSSVGQLGELS